MRGCKPDEHAEPSSFGQAFEDEEPADVGGAGIDGLVDKGGSPPEVGEVAEGDIAGVWACGIDVW